MAFSEFRGGFDPTKEKKGTVNAREQSVEFTLDKKGRRVIPEHEVTLTFVRSGGSGGQKVNKTSSKAELHWHVGRSGSFSAEEKALIREKLKVSKDDEIILQCDEERSQSQNKAACIERLHQKAHEAIQVPEERVETHVPKGIKKKNADSDFREARKKACRKKVDW